MNTIGNRLWLKAHALPTTDRTDAHKLLDIASEARIHQLAKRCGRTFSAMHKHLRSECHWQPKLVIALLSRAD